MFIFMLNKRKCKKAAGTGVAFSVPPDPLLLREGHAPSRTLPRL